MFPGQSLDVMRRRVNVFCLSVDLCQNDHHRQYSITGQKNWDDFFYRSSIGLTRRGHHSRRKGGGGGGSGDGAGGGRGGGNGNSRTSWCILR